MSSILVSSPRLARLVVGLLLACVVPCAGASPSQLMHKPAPDFTRNDIYGHRVNLASFRGHVVLLTFWATWCAPCQIEMPHLVRWQSQFGPQGLQIVAISMDDSAAPVRSLARKRGVNYPVIMGDEELGALYGGVLGLPVTFLIDRDGKIDAVFKGESDLNRLKMRISSLLKSP